MVSIIMPVYNTGMFLKEAISDILSQTYSDFELICVDDGSTDQSGKILDFFSKKDKRIRVITQENLGAAAARNKGIEIAKGEYFLFLDSDDRFDKHLLEKSVHRIEEINADILIFDAQCFDSNYEMFINSDWVLKTEYIPPKINFSYRDYPEKFFNISASGTWNKLFRADLIKSNNIQFMNSPYMNDSYFVLIALVRADNISICTEKLVFYRQNQASSITNKDSRRKSIYCPVEVLSKIKLELERIGAYDILWKSFANYAIPHIFWNEDAIGYEDFNKYFWDVKNKYLEYFRINELSDEEILDSVYLRKIQYLNKFGVSGLLYANCQHKDEIIDGVSIDNSRLKEQVAEISNYCFWIPGVEKGKKIAIYGAGYRGQKLFNIVCKTDSYIISQWVDRNFKSKKNIGFKIDSPEKLDEKIFDYLIIAIDDVDVSKQVWKDLSTKIPKEKIIW